ncbi:nose resistant to fluoxetine protein 6 [Caerostris extrusa]|uniref:Nose resistant to fluoxetine protein 6 n=1 Tax=Caerostris extrusa TaxID=172846 RepID=A0AAV4WQN1_CAEEX|nr:nose resistant to fluoxetine protein 6 [Caerostris extrusa]
MGKRWSEGWLSFTQLSTGQLFAMALAWMVYACCAGHGVSDFHGEGRAVCSIYIKHHLKSLVESVGMFPNQDLGIHVLVANFKTKLHAAHTNHVLPRRHTERAHVYGSLQPGYVFHILYCCKFRSGLVCYLLFQVPYDAVEGLFFCKTAGNIWGANPVTVSQDDLKTNDEEKASIDEEIKSVKSKVLFNRKEETERF